MSLVLKLAISVLALLAVTVDAFGGHRGRRGHGQSRQGFSCGPQVAPQACYQPPTQAQSVPAFRLPPPEIASSPVMQRYIAENAAKKCQNGSCPK